jgi:acyl-CoA thioester hydrolase
MTGHPATDAVVRTAVPFARRYRVRFDEAGPDGLLRTSGLLRYAQDVAWLHSEALGFDRPWYEARGLAWLVRGAELEVVAAIPMGSELEVSTVVDGWRKVWARRRGEVRLADGTLGAWVHTDWVLVGLDGGLRRIPREFGDAFPGAEATYPITRVNLDRPPDTATRARLVVRPHELDPNGHANNAAYLDWLDDHVVEAAAESIESEGAEAIRALPRRYRLEYVAPATPGAPLDAATWRDGEGWAHLLTAPDGSVRFRARLTS